MASDFTIDIQLTELGFHHIPEFNEELPLKESSQISSSHSPPDIPAPSNLPVDPRVLQLVQRNVCSLPKALPVAETTTNTPSTQSTHELEINQPQGSQHLTVIKNDSFSDKAASLKSNVTTTPAATAKQTVAVENKKDDGKTVTTETTATCVDLHPIVRESSTGKTADAEKVVTQNDERNTQNSSNINQESSAEKTATPEKAATQNDERITLNVSNLRQEDAGCDDSDDSEVSEQDEEEEEEEEDIDDAQFLAPDAAGERQCNVCHQTFNNGFLLREHMHVHTGVRPYRCAECGKQFCHLANYRAHLRSHAESASVRCCVCQASFESEERLQTHLQHTHFESEFYQCDFCKRIFTRLEDCEIHVHNHESEASLPQCSKCGRRFKQEKSLRRHLRKRCCQRSYVCGDCGQSFRKKNALLRHSFTHLGLLPYTCTHCNTHFRLARFYRRHKCKPEAIQCVACLFTFTSHKDFEEHKKATGCWGSLQLQRQNREEIRCMECGQTFGTAEELKKHAGSHQRVLKCAECGMGFRSALMLMSHMGGHVGQRPCLCQQCGLGFPHQQGYNLHLKDCGVTPPAKVSCFRLSVESVVTDTISLRSLDVGTRAVYLIYIFSSVCRISGHRYHLPKESHRDTWYTKNVTNYLISLFLFFLLQVTTKKKQAAQSDPAKKSRATAKKQPASTPPENRTTQEANTVTAAQTRQSEPTENTMKAAQTRQSEPTANTLKAAQTCHPEPTANTVKVAQTRQPEPTANIAKVAQTHQPELTANIVKVAQTRQPEPTVPKKPAESGWRLSLDTAPPPNTPLVVLLPVSAGVPTGLQVTAPEPQNFSLKKQNSVAASVQPPQTQQSNASTILNFEQNAPVLDSFEAPQALQCQQQKLITLPQLCLNPPVIKTELENTGFTQMCTLSGFGNTSDASSTVQVKKEESREEADEFRFCEEKVNILPLKTEINIKGEFTTLDLKTEVALKDVILPDVTKKTDAFVDISDGQEQSNLLITDIRSKGTENLEQSNLMISDVRSGTGESLEKSDWLITDVRSESSILECFNSREEKTQQCETETCSQVSDHHAVPLDLRLNINSNECPKTCSQENTVSCVLEETVPPGHRHGLEANKFGDNSSFTTVEVDLGDDQRDEQGEVEGEPHECVTCGRIILEGDLVQHYMEHAVQDGHNLNKRPSRSRSASASSSWCSSPYSAPSSGCSSPSSTPPASPPSKRLRSRAK
ncbi:hypothetical protein ACEWY4_019859 [Coilia grayii]|uniref:C2H2-type domain-containing protein n=1 Tax=Coilia grayii TaxID=363190 RepID=A0ABD1JAX8_9TELE